MINAKSKRNVNDPRGMILHNEETVAQDSARAKGIDKKDGTRYGGPM